MMEELPSNLIERIIDASQTKDFIERWKKRNQTITLCAVGGHHQNGIVDRNIKELTLISHTLLLHENFHCPNYTTTIMWPFALKEAAFVLISFLFDQI